MPHGQQRPTNAQAESSVINRVNKIDILSKLSGRVQLLFAIT
jgi:hypothetical protein